MKAKIKYSIYFLMSLFLMSSCGKNDDFLGSDELITTTRDVADFTKINVQNDMVVYVTHGNPQTVEITVNNNLQDQLFTDVSNNVLNLSLQGGSYENATFIIRVTMPTLEKIQLNDNTKGFVNATSDDLEVEIKGSSRLEIQGSSQVLNAIMKDDGRLNGFSFETTRLNTESKDASEIRITCTDIITGSVSQAAKVFYRGAPTIDTQISDAGSVVNSN